VKTAQDDRCNHKTRDELDVSDKTMKVESRKSTKLLQTTLLRSVSRSFYLSIRFLPVQLREPIALAYLLARATDSVADTPGISVPVRIETLKMMSDGRTATARVIAGLS
jgi:phytoene/squalene synthetase